jgi:hypothetical protein
VIRFFDESDTLIEEISYVSVLNSRQEEFIALSSPNQLIARVEFEETPFGGVGVPAMSGSLYVTSSAAIPEPSTCLITTILIGAGLLHRRR